MRQSKRRSVFAVFLAWFTILFFMVAGPVAWIVDFFSGNSHANFFTAFSALGAFCLGAAVLRRETGKETERGTNKLYWHRLSSFTLLALLLFACIFGPVALWLWLVLHGIHSIFDGIGLLLCLVISIGGGWLVSRTLMRSSKFFLSHRGPLSTPES
jgi:hypothetical protein